MTHLAKVLGIAACLCLALVFVSRGYGENEAGDTGGNADGKISERTRSVQISDGETSKLSDSERKKEHERLIKIVKLRQESLAVLEWGIKDVENRAAVYATAARAHLLPDNIPYLQGRLRDLHGEIARLTELSIDLRLRLSGATIRWRITEKYLPLGDKDEEKQNQHDKAKGTTLEEFNLKSLQEDLEKALSEGEKVNPEWILHTAEIISISCAIKTVVNLEKERKRDAEEVEKDMKKALIDAVELRKLSDRRARLLIKYQEAERKYQEAKDALKYHIEELDR